MKLIFYFLWFFNLISLSFMLNMKQNLTISADLSSQIETSRIISNCSINNCKSCINDKCNLCLDEYILNENKCYSKYMVNNY